MLIDLDEIIQKFEEAEDKGEVPTPEELGIDREDFRKPANEIVEELRERGADLDWWMGDKTRYEQGVLDLGADPPNVSVVEVSEMLGINYDTLMRLVQEKLNEHWSIITETVEEDEKTVEVLTDPSSVSLTDLPEILIDLGNKLLSRSPKDKMKWAAMLLKEHGEDEVTVRQYFRAHWLFDRVLKAETARVVKDFEIRGRKE